MNSENIHTFKCNFDLRYYPKQRTIQLKPIGDKHIHFSIAWAKPRESMSIEDFKECVYNPIIEYLNDTNWTLTFQPVKACENCTYGHFDESFESLLLSLRDKYPMLCSDKDLPVDDPRHIHLRDEGIKEPIFLHMPHSKGNNKKINEFLKEAKNDKHLEMQITIR